MDNGYVIPGLNDKWTFAGADILEWGTGLLGAMVVYLLFDEPITFIISLILFPYSLAGLRMKFPDEHRGIVNALLVKIGIGPPGIPSPSSINKFFSGAPQKELNKMDDFRKLNLYCIFEESAEEQDIHFYNKGK